MAIGTRLVTNRGWREFMPRIFGLITSMVVAALVLLLAPLAASPQIDDSPARFTAAAVDMNRGAAGTVEFVVNRWSSEPTAIG